MIGKVKSMPIDRYLELKKPKYQYIKVIPHKGIRNYNGKNIAKTVANTYKAIGKRLIKEQKKLFFETQFKVSYLVDVKKNDVNFYFLVPQPYVSVLRNKVSEIWDKATVEIMDEGIEPFSSKAEVYEVSYKKEDALSLDVDNRTNEPMSSILSVIDVMKEDDRVGICYNFMPVSQQGWSDKHSETMDKVRKNKIIEKSEFNLNFILKKIFVGTVAIMDMFLNEVASFLGGKEDTKAIDIYENVVGTLVKRQEVSSLTKKKRELPVLQTQIAVLSDSVDQDRRIENALSVCQSFSVLDGDNELKYRRLKNKQLSLEDYSLGTKTSYISTEEASNFIQIPGRELLNKFRIEHIKTNENPVPEGLQVGKKRYGTVTVKGRQTTAYVEDEYNNGSLPMLAIGSQGSGKTTYFKNYARDCYKAGESVVVFDFIKNCELCDSIREAIDEKDIIDIDLSSIDGIQGFGYNEIKIDDNMSDFDKVKLANLQAQQVMSFVDSISNGSPLTGRMRRFLSAAANVVLVQKNNSIRNVIECLEDFEIRTRYIENLSSTQKEYLRDEIKSLDELNEYSKPDKEGNRELVGTHYSKIEHILDRISLLREDFKLKFMYNMSLENNIDFVSAMDEGKVILLRMKESEFPTKMQKNIIVTYFTSKLWLASQLRGAKYKQPKRCNVIIDEIFQSPTVLSNLEYIIVQTRKYGLKFFFSTQYTSQLKDVITTLEGAGCSFMLLTGSTEEDFNRFKSKMPDFEFADLRDMPKFHSLCLIKYSDGYASFIAKLPAPPRNEDY